MDIGVRAGDRVAAMLAASARPRLGSGTEKPLSEPEGKALFADPQRTLKQQRARECVAPDRVVETPADGLVAVKWEERHAGKLRLAGRFRRVAAGAIDGHGS